MAPPFRVAEFDVMFNQGISKEGDLIELGEQMNIIKKSGSFYSFENTRIGQGRENAKTFLRDNIDMSLNIENKIRVASELSAQPAEEKITVQIEESVLPNTPR